MAKTEERVTNNLIRINYDYISCIKIRGLHILPPLLSDEKRKRMQYYRDLAVQIEDNIKSRKLHRNFIESTDDENSATYFDSEVSTNSESLTSSTDKSSKISFKSPIFGDSCRSGVLELLNDTQQNNLIEIENTETVELPLSDKSAILNVPLNVCEIEKDINVCLEQDKYNPQVDLAFSDASISNNGSGDFETNLINYNNNSSPKSSKEHTPIIRRNSYVLENPSPYLLALMERDASYNSCSSPPPSNHNNSNSSGHRRRQWDLEQAKEKWSSIEHDLNNAARNCRNNPNNSYNFSSLPNSTSGSPESRMFNTFNGSTQNNMHRTISMHVPERESEIPTNEKPKKKSERRIKSCVSANKNECRTVDISNSNKFIKSYATPPRKPNQYKKPDKNIVKQPEKTIKPPDSPLLNKKTDFLKITPYPANKQLKLSTDDSKLKGTQSLKSRPQTIKNTTSVVNSKFEKTSPPSCKSNNSTPKSNALITMPKKIKVINSEEYEKYFKEIIDKIHSEQSKQMTILLRRQKQEQQALMKKFAEQQAMLLMHLTATYPNSTKVTNEFNLTDIIDPVIQETNEYLIESSYNSPSVDLFKSSENLLTECRKLLEYNTPKSNSTNSESSGTLNQTICNITNSSPEDTLTNFTLQSDHIETDSFNTPSLKSDKQNSPQVIELDETMNGSIIESNNVKCLKAITNYMSSSSKSSDTYSIDSLNSGALVNGNKVVPNKRISCSRQLLFPTEKQIWAASKISALVRGFLVRRLIKTERVQHLIKTIRDTLVCAMQLHHETVDNIEAADVELHRRLIQQVTSACYDFHDTFFLLSKKDQMSIIAVDRERQKEKLSRPNSANNTSITSTTQKVIERKLKRRSSESSHSANASTTHSRCSNSRTEEFRGRTRSFGMQDTENKKTSPQNDVMSRAMSYGANKKPWR